MPKSRGTKSRRRTRSKNGNPVVFRKLSNVAFNGLDRGINGVSRLSRGALRLTGNVVKIGTGAANRVLGASGRIGRRISSTARKSLRKK